MRVQNRKSAAFHQADHTKLFEHRIETVVKATVLKNGRISFRAPSCMRPLKNRVYVIFNRATGQRYIGRSSQEFHKRLAQHSYLANKCDARRAQSMLYQAIRKDPKNFCFGLFKKTFSNPSLLIQQEIEEIKSTPLHLRLNHQLGGGGVSFESVVSPVKKKPRFYETPEKSYALEGTASDRLKAKITPSTKDLKGCVYQIKDTVSGMRYVGMTSQSFEKRMAQHLSAAKCQEEEASSQKLYDDLIKRPEDFTCGILACNISRSDLREVESRYIERKDSLFSGYNCNRGGGGSVSGSF